MRSGSLALWPLTLNTDLCHLFNGLNPQINYPQPGTNDLSPALADHGLVIKMAEDDSGPSTGPLICDHDSVLVVSDPGITTLDLGV
jgi:hypothetical protein